MVCTHQGNREREEEGDGDVRDDGGADAGAEISEEEILLGVVGDITFTLLCEACVGNGLEPWRLKDDYADWRE